MGREYDVLDIARYIINECNRKGIVISNLKLQKLLYFVQGYMLAFAGHRCFSDEIQAWDYGPVCPSAYHQFKKYGAINIPTIDCYETVELDGDTIRWVKNKFDSNTIDSETREIIDAVIDCYGKYSATTLVAIAHDQQPWKETYYSHPSEKNVVIDENLIRRFFEKEISGD